ncbi:MAG: hypothetical protein NTV25_05585 [Methanothrix sp.]|nr:hypothetical protein [Methanothrix sp.]
MRKILLILILLALIAPSLALTDYQRGVLDGLNRGWFMAQRYDQAQAGNPTAYNQAVLEYNTWIESLFGKNESLMLKTILPSPRGQPYSISKTFTPIHEIDASWNQTRQAQQPQPDANGLINGYPTEIYDSWGPALSSF